jgi:hypothetical protein
MRFLHAARRGLLCLAAVLVACSSMASVAWADASVPPAAPEKSYVLPYFLVVLACALGLMLVCRSSHRTKEVKENLDE